MNGRHTGSCREHGHAPIDCPNLTDSDIAYANEPKEHEEYEYDEGVTLEEGFPGYLMAWQSLVTDLRRKLAGTQQELEGFKHTNNEFTRKIVELRDIIARLELDLKGYSGDVSAGGD